MTNRSICFSLASCLVLAATLSLGAGPIPLSGFELGPAKGNQSSATISAGANGFLVAWRDTRVASNGEIRITRLDANGAVTNPAGILISASDSTQYGGTTTQPSVAWTGERWLVAFATQGGLSIVPVSADGNLLATPRTIAFGELSPQYRHGLLAVADRVFVTGISQRGATFMILSALGDVLSPPRLVEPHSDARHLTALHAASMNGEVLLLDESAYPCGTCPAFVSHRVRLDGVEIARSPVTDPEKNHFGYSRLGRFRDGFVVVGWKQNGSVEYLLLSDDATAVSSHGTLAPGTQSGYYPSEIVLRQGAAATEAWYFQQTENPGYPHLFRSLLFGDGRITTSEFPLAHMPIGELSIASSASLTVAVVARYAEAYETDLVAFAASSTDALQDSTGFPVTLAAPLQSEARMIRRGEETLVTWVERTGDSPGGKVRATLLDRDGRPREAPPIDLFPTAAYAIATDGVEYLVAKDSLGKIRVRRLRSDLTWRDPDWTTVVSSSCSLLRDDAVTWDGNGWWLGWPTCGEGGDPIVQRLDRDLQPLTGPVTIESDEPPGEIHLVPLGGAIVVLWLGAIPPCQICTCVTPLSPLLGARVSTEGVVLTPSARIVEEVEYASLDIASNGSEILALWSGGLLGGTRIRSDLSTPDVTTDQYGTHGATLEEKYSDTLDVAWDGEAWVAVSNALAYDGTYHRTFTFRRFVPSGDLAAAWNGADQRQLDTSVRSGRATVSAAPGGPTLLLHELANESTTGVLRYFVRNLTDAPRSRGVRR